MKRMLKQPFKIPGRRWMPRASVAIILRHRNTPSPELLLIKRAERVGDPWSGDMAFPGGKMDKNDRNAFHTALRELHEEIGLESNKLSPLRRLSDQITKTHSGWRPMAISVFVFELIDEAHFTPNHEVAELVWIPLNHFTLPANRKSMTWKVKGANVNVPCYWYKSRRIWGLTLRMIDNLTQK